MPMRHHLIAPDISSSHRSRYHSWSTLSANSMTRFHCRGDDMNRANAPRTYVGRFLYPSGQPHPSPAARTNHPGMGFHAGVIRNASGCQEALSSGRQRSPSLSRPRIGPPAIRQQSIRVPIPFLGTVLSLWDRYIVLELA